MAVANRIHAMLSESSIIRKMFDDGRNLKNQYGDKNVYDFSLGNPIISPPQEFNKTLIKIIQADIPGKHSYMPNAGYPEVRQSIAEYISTEQEVELNKDHMIMTCGAAGALNITFKSIVNPGDVVLVSTPCFLVYKAYISNHEGVLEFVDSQEDFNLDVDAIASRITKKTAAVLINSPNNPSGCVYPESAITSLCDMLKKKSKEVGREIYLVSDEPYRKIVFDGIQVAPILKYYKNSIVISSYSKDLSIAGERIGCIAIHPEADDCETLVNSMIMCNTNLGFTNAPALMQRAVQHLQGLSVDVNVYKKKRDKLCSNLSLMGYNFIKPEGTFYIFPKAPGGNDLNFVEILKTFHILTVPGIGFAKPGYFRIAYCVEDEVIENSLEGFNKAIKKFAR
jgi:aspartate aminotransferase